MSAYFSVILRCSSVKVSTIILLHALTNEKISYLLVVNYL
ncbi:MAG: hypothetical protein ACI85O_003481 [Saprospiraceae bacterium]